MSALVAVTSNQRVYTLRLPKFFSLSFEVGAVNLAADINQPRRNIMEIYDFGNGVSLLKISCTETHGLKFGYNGATVTEYGVNLDSTYATAYTTITMEVKPLQLRAVSSADAMDSRLYSVPSNTNTEGNLYTMLLSSNSANSALGNVRNIIVTGE